MKLTIVWITLELIFYITCWITIIAFYDINKFVFEYPYVFIVIVFIIGNFFYFYRIYSVAIFFLQFLIESLQRGNRMSSRILIRNISEFEEIFFLMLISLKNLPFSMMPYAIVAANRFIR